MAKIQQEIHYGSLELLLIQAQLYWHIRPMAERDGLRLQVRKRHCLAGIVQ
jgi:hypothetical protein